MRRRLLAGFLLFTLTMIVALEVPFGLSLASNARSTALSELQADGTSLGVLLSSTIERGEVSAGQALVTRFAKDEGAVVLVISGDKPYLSAGQGASEELADPGTHPILVAAEGGRTAGEEGTNDSDDDFLYAALPIVGKAGSRPAGPDVSASSDVVLLVAEPAATLHARISDDWIRLGVFGAAMLAIAAAIGSLLARSLTRPLADIEKAVGALGAGMLSERAPSNRGAPELQALARAVNAMAARIEELLSTQRAFIADASHQLRTPMTALRLRLENLEGSLPAEHVVDVAPVVAEVDRISRIVDGLLTLARTEGTRPARLAVDVPSALQERVEAWAPLAEEKQVSLVTVPSEKKSLTLQALACDGYLEQVLDNLLSNALDATPPGGQVEVYAERSGAEVEIHVVDSGSGMSTADRAKAFDRFWRPEGARHEGTGLGLAIVDQLVARVGRISMAGRRRGWRHRCSGEAPGNRCRLSGERTGLRPTLGSQPPRRHCCCYCSPSKARPSHSFTSSSRFTSSSGWC